LEIKGTTFQSTQFRLFLAPEMTQNNDFETWPPDARNGPLGIKGQRATFQSTQFRLFLAPEIFQNDDFETWPPETRNGHLGAQGSHVSKYTVSAVAGNVPKQ
jgi:hypothetical protein